MNGTSAKTGKHLSGIEHLRQSLRDILTTPLNSRVMRREYGSRLPRLVDSPMNRSGILELYAATAQAVARWEPRFKLTKVTVASSTPGNIVLDMTGDYLPTGERVTIDGLVVT